MPDIQYDETTGEPYLPITHLGLRLTPYRRTEDDIAAMMEISNAPAVGKWSYTRPYPYIREHATGWLDLLIRRQQADLEYLKHADADGDTSTATPTPTASPFVVIRLQDKYIGDVSLTFEGISPGEAAVEKGWVLAYALHPEYWGRGIASAAVRTLLEWGAERMGADTVYAMIETANTPSTRLVRRLGFAFDRTVMRPWVGQGAGEREIGVWVRRAGESTEVGQVDGRQGK